MSKARLSTMSALEISLVVLVISLLLSACGSPGHEKAHEKFHQHGFSENTQVRVKDSQQNRGLVPMSPPHASGLAGEVEREPSIPSIPGEPLTSSLPCLWFPAPCSRRLVHRRVLGTVPRPASRATRMGRDIDILVPRRSHFLSFYSLEKGVFSPTGQALYR